MDQKIEKKTTTKEKREANPSKKPKTATEKKGMKDASIKAEMLMFSDSYSNLITYWGLATSNWKMYQALKVWAGQVSKLEEKKELEQHARFYCDNATKALYLAVESVLEITNEETVSSKSARIIRRLYGLLNDPTSMLIKKYCNKKIYELINEAENLDMLTFVFKNIVCEKEDGNDE